MIKNNYQIRPMQTADLSAVLLIEQEQEFPWTEKMLQDCLQANYQCWVLENENTIIGFGILMIAGMQADILNIAVKAKQRRQSYGKTLLMHLIKIAYEQQSREIYLEVRVSNLPAINLYKQIGFIQIAVRKNYYKSLDKAEDAIVMRYAQKAPYE